MQFIVEEKDAKKRFDVYLSEQLNVSRSSAQHIIKRNEASIDGKPSGASYRVKIGETIESLPESSKDLRAEEGLLKIIAETPDYIIVDKPAGLTVHATSTRMHGTLANLLLAHYPQIREVGEAHRPGIVHRLDRDVSGCMIVAKNNKSYEALKKQFADRKINKEYTALVFGTVKDGFGTINANVGRNRKGRMAVKADGLDAITHYEVIGRGKKTTLLTIKTETGRMHQIRVHMKYISHPIVGDLLYAPKDAKVKPGRLLLHASKIGFVDLEGKEVSYETEMPAEFKNIP